MTFLSRLFALSAFVLLASCGGGGGGGGGGGSGGNVTSVNLSVLLISPGSITPGFSGNQVNYSATVDFPSDMITITAQPAASSASVSVNGTATDSANSVMFPLNVGENDFIIMVSAGSSSKQYNLTVIRQDLYDIQTYLKSDNPELEDEFGTSVSISGDTMVVGAPKEDSDGNTSTDNSSLESGAAYVYVRSGTGWSQQAYIKASNVDDDDSFGISVAISGDTLVVGAPKEDSDGSSEADNSSSNSGAAYVFTRNGTSWTQQAYLKASNIGDDDEFGRSVDLDGDSLVVGANAEDGNGISEMDNSVSNSGAAYIFVRSGTSWIQQGYLKASNPDVDDNFGSKLSINVDSLIVASAGEDSDGSSQDDNSMSASGAAYVFTRTTGNWTQQAYLKASNADTDDVFASSVSIDGDTVVVGAIGESSDSSSEVDNSMPASGAAYVYTRNGSAWTQQAYLKASNADSADSFGASVAIELDTILVGAPNEAGDASVEVDNSAPAAGAGYIFTRTGNMWTQDYYIKAFNAEAGDSFATAVDLNGGLIGAGSINEDSDRLSNQNNAAESAGAAYIYQ